MSAFNVEAEWHMELKDKDSGKVYAHRVKVSVLDSDLSFYINGMVVYPPGNGQYTEWTVCTPSIPKRKGKVIEFNGQESILWPEIKQACIEAVQEHLRHEGLDKANDVDCNDGLSQEDFNKQLMKDIKKVGF